MPPKSKWTPEEKRQRQREAYQRFIEKAGMLYPAVALSSWRQRQFKEVSMKIPERVQGRLAYSITHSFEPLADHEKVQRPNRKTTQG